MIAFSVVVHKVEPVCKMLYLDIVSTRIAAFTRPLQPVEGRLPAGLSYHQNGFVEMAYVIYKMVKIYHNDTFHYIRITLNFYSELATTKYLYDKRRCCAGWHLPPDGSSSKGC